MNAAKPAYAAGSALKLGGGSSLRRRTPEASSAAEVRARAIEWRRAFCAQRCCRPLGGSFARAGGLADDFSRVVLPRVRSR